MAEVVRANFAPIFSDFEIFEFFLGISARIIAPPSGVFQSYPIRWKCFSSPKKTVQTASKSAYECRRYVLFKKVSYVPKPSSADTVTNEQQERWLSPTKRASAAKNN